ncbi:MAG: hypothetical protein OXI88_00190 [Gammaproteobacteria bacterium]|nr:hypothetical protein [Gammaproteobacteria bacterium]
MSENNGQVSGASRNKEKNAGADGTQAGSGNTTASDSDEQPSFFGKWPVCAQLVLILSIIACIVILLIGLPVASLLIVERMSPGSLEGTVSFWGASFAAFISLAVVFIASAFAFTAFKVETNAQKQMEQAIWDAHKTVEKEVVKEVGEKFDEQVENTIKAFLKEKNDNDGGKISKGEKIAREAADKYIKETEKEENTTRADKITREAADDYIKKADDKTGTPRGDKITMEVANKYLNESTEGEDITRGKKIAKEVVEKFTTEDIKSLINECIERKIEDEMRDTHKLCSAGLSRFSTA